MPVLRLVGALSRLSRRRPRAVVAAVVLLLAVSLAVILTSPLESDVTRLIPAHAEKTSLYLSLMETFGGMEKLYLVFSADDITAHIPEVEKIGAELSSSELVKDVEWKISPEMQRFIRETFLKRAPLLLNRGEMEDFLGKLSAPGIERELQKTQKRLALPGGGALRLDPLSLHELFGRHIMLSEVSVDIESGYFVTPDRRVLIMMAAPTVSPRDIASNEKLMKYVRSLIERHAGGGLKVSITGSHAITYHEASIMKREIVKNILSSAVGVMLVFLVFFRGLRGFLNSIVPVLVSIVLTTGLLTLFWGSITEVSGAFGALLIGLGVDLGIVLYVRYAMSMARGAERDIGGNGAAMSITVGVVTTAATFYPMAISSFGGVKEIGLLTGTGILITWLMLFLLFPILARKGKGEPVKLRFVERIFVFSHERPLLIAAAAILLTALSAYYIKDIKVEEDVTTLGAKKNPARDTLKSLSETYLKKHTLYITGTAKDPYDASEESARIKKSLSGKLDSSISISDLLPPLSRQNENIKALASVDPDSFERAFRQKANALGFEPGALDGYIKGVRGLLTGNRKPITMEELAPLNDIIERLLRKEGAGYRFVITGSLKNGAPMELPGGLQCTGPAFIKKELLGLLKHDALLITLVGLVLVNIILFIDFRRPSYVLVSQVPVLLSTVWLLGLMGLTGMGLNFMNAIVFVMLYGIGTDYSIHLIHRYKEDRDIGHIAAQTGNAVLLAALTTIAGFGSMAGSSYRGLSSMGTATVIGVAVCVILSLTLIPAFFRLYEKAPDGK